MSQPSAWRAFRLVADDVLFFRDGKPNSRGADHYLHSLFPPYPSTLYGAVRTRRLLDEAIELNGLDKQTWSERLDEALRGELGIWGGFGSLALRGPWLVRGDQVLLPAPADLGVVLAAEPSPATTDEDSNPPRIAEVVRYRLEPRAEGGWSHPLATWAPYRRAGAGWQRLAAVELRKVRPSAGWYLTPAGLAAWAAGGIPAAEDLTLRSALWADEVRTGVGLQDTTRQSAKGLLFTFGFIRLRRGVALGFEAAESALQAGGRVRLGGDARTAELGDGPALPPPPPNGAGDRFLISFATPALAAGGGWPPGFAPGATEGRLAGTRCRLLGAIVPGPQLVGGWDLARERSKPLRRALAPGAVFAFEWLETPPPEGAAALWGRNHTDFETEHLARQGFGLTLAGLCP